MKEIKNAIKSGKLIAISGIVGCGKTTLLKRVQDELRQEKDVIVSKSLSIDKGRVKLPTLIMALFYDLATEKDFRIPVQPEKRERKLQDLILKRQKPASYQPRGKEMMMNVLKNDDCVCSDDCEEPRCTVCGGCFCIISDGECISGCNCTVKDRLREKKIVVDKDSRLCMSLRDITAEAFLEFTAVLEIK